MSVVWLEIGNDNQYSVLDTRQNCEINCRSTVCRHNFTTGRHADADVSDCLLDMMMNDGCAS